MLYREGCDICRYWKHGGGDSETENCKRYPPVIDALQAVFAVENGADANSFAEDSVLYWAQPRTFADSWCGEFRLQVERITA